MEPISSTDRRSSAGDTVGISGISVGISGISIDEPTPAEIDAGACLPRALEPLQSRLSEAPAEPAPAVKALVEAYPPSVSAAPPEPPQGSTGAPKGSSVRPGISSVRPGIAVSIGGNLAAGPGIAVGVEASIGVVVDLSVPKISVFTSGAWGTAVAPGVSAGVSGQLSLVKDMTQFWGSGSEYGLNLSPGGAINYSTPTPGGSREFNGVTGSLGPNLGGDAHYLEGSTTERGSISLHEIQDALKRAVGLGEPEPMCVGP